MEGGDVLRKVVMVALRPIPSPSEASGDGIVRVPKPSHVTSARCAGRHGRSATIATDKNRLVAGAGGVTVESIMKTLPGKRNLSGLTQIEVLVVICVIAILAAMLLPYLSGSHKSRLIMCVSQLKQIDLGFQISATDNGGIFPIQKSVSNGGTMEFIYSDHVFPHFQKISKLLVQPKLLACPLDNSRQAATNWEVLNDLNISYFLNADISTNNPSHTILSGDRHLQVAGQPVKSGLFILTTNLNMSWTPNLHAKHGNLAFVDGHVEISTKETLNSYIQQQPLATNRLCVP